MGVAQVIKLGPVQQDLPLQQDQPLQLPASAWCGRPHRLMQQHSQEQGDAVLQSFMSQPLVLEALQTGESPVAVCIPRQGLRRSSNGHPPHVQCQVHLPAETLQRIKRTLGRLSSSSPMGKGSGTHLNTQRCPL